ncbi:asparaginase [Methylibium sp.]|uniref:asparaginase n=1 Tax=Methylibium sp. TaxID=2067992 RepID=UPI00286B30CB|nr:asparaginase [Methylibium sp.]
MQSFPSSAPGRVVILATGGTIAGTAAQPLDVLGYVAAQVGIEALVAALPGLDEQPLETEQVAQLDSKDMDIEVWRALVLRARHHLARPDVAGIVVTHGTDTLEETAYLLQRVLAPSKPLVLTAAMRPSTSLQADGPQNLIDAVNVARVAGASGVVVVMAGWLHGALDVRKTHTHRLDAFGCGDAGPLGRIDAGRLRRVRDWPHGVALGADVLDVDRWPRVEIVLSHAGASGAIVDALLAQGVDGIVAAGTGNGTLHHALEAALLRAKAEGVAVWRSSRVADGGVLSAADAVLPDSGPLTPVQARVELILQLLQCRSVRA